MCLLLRYLYMEKIKCSSALLSNANAISDYNCTWRADSVYKEDFFPSLSLSFISKNYYSTLQTRLLSSAAFTSKCPPKDHPPLAPTRCLRPLPPIQEQRYIQSP